MKSLPRRPRQRKPLHKLDGDMEQRLEPRGHRQQFWAQKASGAPRPKARISELNKLIDDYLEWNQSCSDIEPDRPGSSGTLFVDFVENGDMEVSYRNGVNKKLPSPPLIPTPASVTSLRRRYKADQISNPKVACKPAPSVPSHSARHDSVISSRAAKAERIDPSFIPPAPPPPSFPLPKIPFQTSRSVPGQPRKLYPPQVHQTQRTPSQLPTARHSSPAPSQTSTASFHTARSQRNREAYIDLPAPSSIAAASAASAAAQKHSPSSSPRKPKRHTRSNTPSTTAAMPAAHAKRRKVLALVQKMLQKLEHLKEMPKLHRRRRDEPVGEKPSWVKVGYLT